KRELIEVQRRELARDLVIIGREVLVEVVEAVRGGDREPARILQTGIEEPTLAMHFQCRDERVPVSDRSPSSGPGVLVEAGQAERVRYQCRSGNTGACNDAVGDLPRVESFSIEKDFRVKFSRTPTLQYRLKGRAIHAEQCGEWRQIRRC